MSRSAGANSTHRPVSVNPRRNWQAFDSLPKCVRQVLADAHMNYACEGLAARWRARQQSGWLPSQFAAYLDNRIKDKAIEDWLDTYGEGFR